MLTTAALLLTSITHAAPPTLPPLGIPPAVTPAPINIPLASSCSALTALSLDIIGRVPVTGSMGERLYRLKLRGTVKNSGDNNHAAQGQISITEIIPGTGAHTISHLPVRNLGHDQQMLIGALTRPLSSALDFKPQFRLDIENNRRSEDRQCANRRHQLRGPQQLITRDQVAAALRN